VIEHLHWQRKDQSGIEGQHLMIVGYSHYTQKNDRDHEDFTKAAVNKVIYGDDRKYGGAMFSSVPRYFGDFANRGDFWKKVDFFNFIPNSFSDQTKYANANSEQNEIARSRFRRILCEERPDKVFVFSRKAWRACQGTLQKAALDCVILASESDRNWGTFVMDNTIIPVLGLRHPMLANAEKMRAAVQEFLKSS
jgi:hypothetical protein